MRIERSSILILNQGVEKVFPLFGPVEEKKWAPGWDPVFLYPNQQKEEEGMVFKTPADNDEEEWFFWVLTSWVPLQSARYIVHTQNRVWMIRIDCASSKGLRTEIRVEYVYTGLNSLGDQLNRQAMEKMFSRDLRDWEEAINAHLKLYKD